MTQWRIRFDRRNAELTVHQMIRSSALLASALVFALAACRDKSRTDAANDSALARDITLASAVATPTPQLPDTPDSAPAAVEKPAPEEPKPAKAPTRQRVRQPVREEPKPVTPTPTPPPQPVVETPTPAPAPAPAPAPTT